MNVSLFVNFSEEEFMGCWDGKCKKIKSKQQIYLPDFLAKHYAKHLVNRELLRKDKQGNPIYLHGEKSTSPKNPEDNALFMSLFNKAYIPQEKDEDDDVADSVDVSSSIEVINKNKGAQKEAQVIMPPDFDEEDDEEFENKVNEKTEKKTKKKTKKKSKK